MHTHRSQIVVPLVVAGIVPLSISLLLTLATQVALHAETGHFGTARININPTTPIRLSGYAARTTEATGVQQDIYATAAAYGTGADTAILIAVDCTGVSDNVADVVSTSLSQQLGIPRERINIICTHTHNGPCVHGYLDNLFGAPLPPDQQERVDVYTQLLTNRLEEVALDAIANSTPGHTITWGKGAVGFGVNRRGAGIVDHELPVIRVADFLGNTKAVIASYASHAVTLNSNSVSGDWPGYAREAIEALYPGATALIMIGAAGDINSSPSGSIVAAQGQGQAIANEVARLVNNNLLMPVKSNIGAARGEIDLPFASALTPGDPGSARLAPAGAPDLQYGISTWTFGDEIAMVFLEGEVTVDYSLRLKSELNDGRMWVNAYSNDVPGYIPSERILYEGGYEADGSGFYYALPGRFAHGLEDKIVSEVLRQLDPFLNPLDRLRLVVDRATGAVSIVNQGNEPISFDAYTITSGEGLLSGPWNSLAAQGTAGWEEATNTSSQRITEFNPLGLTALASGGGALSLGALFSQPPPPSFGMHVADVELQFEYSAEGNASQRGKVEFVGGPGRHNNLVLTINPTTGEAAIQNESEFFDVEIAAYTIASTSGRLRIGDSYWNSLADQEITGWEQADNVGAFRLTEFNPFNDTPMDGGGNVLYLGMPVDVSGEPLDLDDFEFQLLLSTGEILLGVIELGALPGATLPGDYDGDGIVDSDDYDQWRTTFGQSVPAGSGADGNGDGIIDAADYTVWRDNLNHDGSPPSRAVPEPSATALTAALTLGLAGFWRQRQSY